MSALSVTVSDRVDELWKQVYKFDKITNDHHDKITEHTGNIIELKKRMHAVEDTNIR